MDSVEVNMWNGLGDLEQNGNQILACALRVMFWADCNDKYKIFRANYELAIENGYEQYKEMIKNKMDWDFI